MTNTIERHLQGINNYFENNTTNTAIEGLHFKLKLSRQRTKGIVDKDFFFYSIIEYFA